MDRKGSTHRRRNCQLAATKLFGSCWALRAVTCLPQRDDEAAQRLFFTGEADVVGGNEHLSQDVHLVEGGPQGAVRVPVQFFIFGQSEERPVTLALGSGIQVPAGWRIM